MSTEHRILFFDIESAPLLAHVWGQRADWIPPGQILHDSFMLTWAAKWSDQKRVLSDKLTGTEAEEQDDGRIVASLADLLREADIVVAHNADRFDVPVLNTRLLRQGLEPLGPVKTIDTLKLAKRTFRLASNKLDYIAHALGLDTKLSTGFDLWRRCYLGDEKALAYMARYNRRDVVVLEQVFEALKPHVKGLPRMVEAEAEGERACPYCGSDDLQKRGFRHTNASTFQQWQCQNPSCMRWSRSRTSEPARLATVPV